MRRRRPFHPLLRLFLLWLLLPALIVLTTRLIWGYRSAHRLADLRQKLHNQGLKVFPADFPDPASIPPTDNAAVAVAESIRLFTTSHKTASSTLSTEFRHDDAGHLDLQRTVQESADLRAIYTRARPAFELLDQAAQRAQIIWPQPSFERDRNYLHVVRGMCTLLLNMAIIAHGEHDDAQALLHLRRVFVLGTAYAESTHSDATSIYQEQINYGAEAVIDLLPVLDFSSPATVTEARALLRSLQNEPPPDTLANSYQAYLAGHFDDLPQYHAHKFWLLNPLAQDSNARAIQAVAADLIPTLSGNFQRAKVHLARPPAHSTYLDRIFRQGANFYLPSINSLKYHRAIAARRTAALLLAARLYALDHAAPPADPAALVPDLLPSLPLDPFADPDQPLHYRIALPNLAVWSVGPNNIDDSAVRSNPRNDDQVVTLTFPTPTSTNP